MRSPGDDRVAMRSRSFLKVRARDGATRAAKNGVVEQ